MKVVSYQPTCPMRPTGRSLVLPGRSLVLPGSYPVHLFFFP